MVFAFYISGKSGRLGKFLLQSNIAIKESIKLVFSDYPIEGKLRELIEGESINIYEMDYSQIPGKSGSDRSIVLSNEMLTVFEDNDVDYCFSFGSHILTGDLLNKYKYRIINFHPSILPMFPGINAMDQAEKHGNVLLIGNSAHFIDRGVDTGPLIMQSVTTIHPFLYERNYDLVLDQQIEMLNRIISAIINDDLTIQGGRVIIKNADYNVMHMFPEYQSCNIKK